MENYLNEEKNMPVPIIFGNPILGATKAAKKYLVDNIKAVKKIEIGSVVYCGLLNNNLEHSGIYIGNNEIVHLDGSGLIEIVSPETFLNRLDGLNMALSIYVSCKDGKSVGLAKVAENAKKKIGQKIDYHVVKNNCHMFSSGCLTGTFENKDRAFFLLKYTTSSIFVLDY